MSEKRNDKRFSISWLPRGRWNILDLIDLGRLSVPTYLFCEVDMSWAEALRSRLGELGKKVTVTAILLKAIAIAQRSHPQSRAAMLPWGRVITFNDIVAGFTVERHVDCGPAVFLGTIRDPETKPLAQIACELKDYGSRQIEEVPQLAIEHRFASMPWLFRKFILWLGMRFPAVRLKYMSATFGVSSLGKYGLRAIIPPGVCTSIFGVGEVEQRPVVVNGEICVRPMLSLTLNFDHRLIDGAPAARFLAEVRDLLQGGLATYVEAEIANLAGGLAAPHPVRNAVLSADGQVVTV